MLARWAYCCRDTNKCAVQLIDSRFEFSRVNRSGSAKHRVQRTASMPMWSRSAMDTPDDPSESNCRTSELSCDRRSRCLEDAPGKSPTRSRISVQVRREPRSAGGIAGVSAFTPTTQCWRTEETDRYHSGIDARYPSSDRPARRRASSERSISRSRSTA